MSRSGVISLIIIFCITGTILYVPYIEFLEPESKFKQHNQLIDNLLAFNNYPVNIAYLLTLFYPMLLILESTFWTPPFKTSQLLIFLAQALIFGFGSFLVGFNMTFHLFTGPYTYLPGIYLICGYLVIGVTWSLLLAIPYFKHSKFICENFKRLSLIVK